MEIVIIVEEGGVLTLGNAVDPRSEAQKTMIGDLVNVMYPWISEIFRRLILPIVHLPGEDLLRVEDLLRGEDLLLGENLIGAQDRQGPDRLVRQL